MSRAASESEVIPFEGRRGRKPKTTIYKSSSGEEFERITAYFPMEMAKRLRIKGVTEQVKVSTLIVEAVGRYLNEPSVSESQKAVAQTMFANIVHDQLQKAAEGITKAHAKTFRRLVGEDQ